MIRRPATRIELKLDDMKEYDEINKDQEDRHKQQTNNSNNKTTDPSSSSSSSAASSSSSGTGITGNGLKPKDLTTHERIGFVRK
ncbi:anaphase-promoting complex subunit CDC26-like [Oppia nitens]|uniref:anaphase-promoting complex subunit CDC26-like n=1 Tax=Oppia nitens TaxID=1686743 RepID=UPI0023DC888B|nr:anaphase-promoting complex subunit CDC26-like [Oppia nitens]